MSKRSDDDLRALSDHLLYEMRMLRRGDLVLAIGEAARGAGPESSELLRTVESALLESWALHARNLIDFLYPPDSRQPDDAFAEDFFEPAEWDRVRPPKGRTLPRVKRRAGKELMHLTYERINVAPELKPWDVPAMLAELMEPLMAFIDNVPARRVSEEFARYAGLQITPPDGGGWSVATAVAAP